MANLFPTESKALITSTTVVVDGDAFPCRGYSVVVADVTIDSTAQVNFEASADSGTTYRYIIGAPTIGTAGTTSATASGHFRFNVAGMDFWRPVAATVSVGAVSVVAIGQAGGTDAVVSQSGGSSVTQGGGFDVRLIASTPTIGNVGQAGGWDVRLIASTATAATVTAVNRQSNTAPSLVTQNIGLISTTTLAANASRLGWWIQNTSKQFVYLGFGQTPTSVTYHVVLTSCTVAHDGTGGFFSDTFHKGAVNAICGVATGTVTIGEWVP